MSKRQKVQVTEVNQLGGALNVGTAHTFKLHNVGTVPTFKMHNVGTVPTFEMDNVGTVPTYKTHNIGTELSYVTLSTTIKFNSNKSNLIMIL